MPSEGGGGGGLSGCSPLLPTDRSTCRRCSLAPIDRDDVCCRQERIQREAEAQGDGGGDGDGEETRGKRGVSRVGVGGLEDRSGGLAVIEKYAEACDGPEAAMCLGNCFTAATLPRQITARVASVMPRD